MRIRKAGEADLPAIARILNAEIRDGVNVWHESERSLPDLKTWLREREAGGFATLVAELDEKIAGYATYGPFRPHSGYRHSVEHSVYVDPAFRRRGIARALLGALIDDATGRGFHMMLGGIEAGNAASVALHAALGFEETARLPEVGRKFDRWLTLVFMQRTLSD